MDNFFRYFYQDVGRVFRAFIDIISAIFNFFNYLFNFPMRMQIIQEHDDTFGTGDWILLVITEIVLIAICVAILFFVFKLLKKVFRFRVSVKKYDELAKQVKTLQKDLIRANYEKDRLLQMHVAGLGLSPDEALAALDEEGEEKEEKEEIQALESNRNTMETA